MLVDDVRAQRDVVGRGHVVQPRLVKHAIVFVRKTIRILVYVPRQAFAISVAFGRACLDGFVHPTACLFPHAKGTVFNRGGNVFGSAAQIRQLKIVNAARAVAR